MKLNDRVNSSILANNVQQGGMQNYTNVSYCRYYTSKIYANSQVAEKKSHKSKAGLFKLGYLAGSFRHKFHLVDPSPWPIAASIGALITATGGVLYMHRFIGGWSLLVKGWLIIVYVMFVWWRDIVREATYEGHHTFKVQRGLRLGVIFFIVSEIMFFFGFFWAFFHSSLSPSHVIGGVWPPSAIKPIKWYLTPLTNTAILIGSGVTITWAHHAVKLRAKRHGVISLLYTILLAVLFTCFQVNEYISLPFSISDGVYGSCFYMTTGLHGFHVIAGAIAIIVSLVRLAKNHFTNKQHVGLDSSVWYWHFVDVVWIFLFFTVYMWGNAGV